VLDTVHIYCVAWTAYHGDAWLLFDNVIAVTLVCGPNTAFPWNRSSWWKIALGINALGSSVDYFEEILLFFHVAIEAFLIRS